MVKTRHRKRHCLNCHKPFLPNPRLKARQRHCSNPLCQKKRRNQNIRDWYKRNPDCLEYQRDKTREWFKKHPSYSCDRRANKPSLRDKNSLDSRARMCLKRRKDLFDKTNSIFSQLIDVKRDKCFLTKGRKWLVVCLTKQTRLRRIGALWQNRPTIKKLPMSIGACGYELTQEFYTRRTE